MTRTYESDVAIIGAGPVGLTLAIDLARRGVSVTVVETRRAGEPPSAKCNHVSSRTMEILRRLGFVDRVRAAGLPDDYPNDVVVRTRATGYELTRMPIPNRLERYTSMDGIDCGWPTPEPPHRINQLFFEPILFDEAKAAAGITIVNRCEATGFDQDEAGVTLHARLLDGDAPVAVRAQYLVGAEGGASPTRRAIGATLEGDAEIQRVQTSYIRAPGLLEAIPTGRAWMSYLYNPARAGNLVAIDGRETWLVHNYLLPGETDFDSVDRDACLRLLLGVDADFGIEILAKEDWIGRRLVATKFRDRRVFICGDAAHLWVPYAGYGMNAAIADAMNLSWLLAAHLNGWAPEAILDAHEAERKPITEQVSRFAMKHAEGSIRERTTVPAWLEEDSARGEEARRAVGRAAYDHNVQQFACAGLNYGYYYDASPIIAYDGEAAPAYSMADYTPSSAPGCRTPHVWLADGRSLYDAMGDDFALLRFDPDADAAPVMAAAKRRGVPVRLVDVEAEDIPDAYRHRLVLSRPDQHVAWRGDGPPDDPLALIDKVRGAAR